ncbi:MAG: XrtA system polysaccharide deacetylase [Thermoguttaceae bacterium]
MLNAFTIDVEDYYQVGAFAHMISPDKWDDWEFRVEKNTSEILDILSKANVKGTFFILGWVAKRAELLVKRIAAEGHVIASHGFWHQLVYTQTEQQFREDVSSTRKMLQDLSGQEVVSYRAPSFSITARTPWAHRVLVEEGYKYDSSVFPIRHDLHGNHNAPTHIHKIETESGPIIEFPPAVVKYLGQNIPTGGGGYFRFFPFEVTKRMLKSINRKGQPFVFYLHPWEIDFDQPRILGAPFKSKFRHYVNLKRTKSRLERLLNSFTFAPMETVLHETAISASGVK